MAKILVVDDDETNCRLVSSIIARMAQEAHQVIALNRATDALRLITETPIDERFSLLITDLSMPGMDGVQFARALRNLGIHVSIILMSAVHTGSTEAESFAILGENLIAQSVIDDYVSKYDLVAALPDKIRRCLA